MNSSSARHSRKATRHLLIESLEARRVLTGYGANVFAVVEGQVLPHSPSIQSFEFSSEDFQFATNRDSVLIQFTVIPKAQSELAPLPVTITSLDAQVVDTLISSSSTIANRASTVVAALKPGNFEIIVRGGPCSSGAYELMAALVGDVDGNRLVDTNDATQLRSLLNTNNTSSRYLPSADYDLDGRITGKDNSLLVRNRGAAMTRLAKLAMVVDSNIAPAVAELPRINESDPSPRTLSRLQSATGEVSDFVDNELYIATDNQAELAAFVARWNGTVTAAIHPADYGFTSLSSMYLVQLDPSNVTGDLNQLLQQLNPTAASGDFSVSSHRGRQLLAVAAEEAATFADRLGISWVAQPSTHDFGLEDPSSRNLPGYNPDTNTWPHLAAGSIQDIGVTEAWRMLRNEGILRHLEAANPFEEGRLELAVFDNGFVPNSDWPTWLPIPNLGMPFGLPTPLPGKEWHGTAVIGAGASVPWNDYGAAGPGGPVVNVWAVPTTYDPFLTIVGLLAVSAEGADLVNMSYHIPVPNILSWSVLPFDFVTAAVRASGTLIFAAAGNEGRDIDAETDYFFFTAEDFWYTPAENSGVIAVGGLGYDSIEKADGSNYGRRDVDIFAPYVVYVGPTAPFDTSSARPVAGTSFSAPFTAGVAGLIWASNPDLSANQVQDILLNTAKTNINLRGRGHRYIDASAAVGSVLGDTDPRVDIHPLTTSEYIQFDQFVSLIAEADDVESTPSLVWSSSIDGFLGTGTDLSRRNLSVGTHTITVTATDSAGQTASDSVTIEIINVPPTMRINNPQLGASFVAGVSLSFIATSRDNTLLGTLEDMDVRWESQQQGPLGTGHQLVVDSLAVGFHRIIVTGVDTFGQSGSDTIWIEIVPAIGSPPQLTVYGRIIPGELGIFPISGPLSFYASQFDPLRNQFYVDLQIVASAIDAEDGLLEDQIVWTSDRTSIYGPAGVVTKSPSGALRLYSTSATQGAIHLLTATVTDSDGQSAFFSLKVTLDVLI